MRRRLAEAHEAAAANPWEVKLGPGRMMDIELLAQTGALLHNLGARAQPAPDARPKLGELGWLARPDAALLAPRLARLAALQQIGRLASDHTIDPAEGGDGLVRLVLAATEHARPRHPPPHASPTRPRRAAAIIGDRLADVPVGVATGGAS